MTLPGLQTLVACACAHLHERVGALDAALRLECCRCERREGGGGEGPGWKVWWRGGRLVKRGGEGGLGRKEGQELNP